jgi:hypothetical protein
MGRLFLALFDLNHFVQAKPNIIDSSIWAFSLTTCNGLQTAAPGPANKGHFRLTFRANKRRLGPTLTANEPTFWANSLQTARWTHIRCTYHPGSPSSLPMNRHVNRPREPSLNA